ncbi:MAG: DUF2344 domain-containing protein [Lachnospiraceae bacterium]|nr:DUF2344 domain-containing protein [Lachnospiraceae bacterium]
MKVRIRFAKTGNMRYIGHLDVMRYFQKAIKRAGIDIAYSKGFSPHPVMSFALPLGVGVSSEGEYLDIEVNSLISSKEAVKALNEVMAEGFSVSDYVLLPDDSKKGMTLVGAADYVISFNQEAGFEIDETTLKGFKAFIDESQTIETVKTGKHGGTFMDIKPLIYRFDVEDFKVFMRLAAGSKNNLKPELVMEEAFKNQGLDFDRNMIVIHRTELLDESCTPLKDLGEIIE